MGDPMSKMAEEYARQFPVGLASVIDAAPPVADVQLFRAAARAMCKLHGEDPPNAKAINAAMVQHGWFIGSRGDRMIYVAPLVIEGGEEPPDDAPVLTAADHDELLGTTTDAQVPEGAAGDDHGAVFGQQHGEAE